MRIKKNFGIINVPLKRIISVIIRIAKGERKKASVITDAFIAITPEQRSRSRPILRSNTYS